MTKEVELRYLSKQNVRSVCDGLERSVYERSGVRFRQSNDMHRLIMCMRNHYYDRIGLVSGKAIQEMACRYDDVQLQSATIQEHLIQLCVERLNFDTIQQLSDDVLDSLQHRQMAVKIYDDREKNQVHHLDDLRCIATTGKNSLPELDKDLIGIDDGGGGGSGGSGGDASMIGEPWTFLNCNTPNDRLTLW